MSMMGRAAPNNPFMLTENEEFVECPYDLSHQVTNFRMLTHLVKCRRNYQKRLEKQGDSVLMMTCKYNWMHQVPAPEIQYHEKRCGDQYQVIPHLLEYNEPDPSNPSSQKKRYELYLTKGIGLGPGAAAIPGAVEIPGAPKPMAPTPRVQSSMSTTSVISSPGSGTSAGEEIEEDWEAECKIKNFRSYDPRPKMEKELMLRYPPNMTKSERRAWKMQNMAKAQRLMAEEMLKDNSQRGGLLPNRFFRPRAETPPPSPMPTPPRTPVSAKPKPESAITIVEKYFRFKDKLGEDNS